MIIHISISDLESNFKDNPTLVDSLYNLGLDYATNLLEGVVEDEMRVVFDFKKYGIKFDNRKNGYEISKGGTFSTDFFSDSS